MAQIYVGFGSYFYHPDHHWHWRTSTLMQNITNVNVELIRQPKGQNWPTVPPSPPPKVGGVLALYISRTTSRWFLSLSLMKSASTSPTIGGGRVGEGCSFSVVPKFRRRPKPTIPLHSKFINDQLCFWHHTLSTNSSSTISSSILSTTRRGEL